MPTLNRAARRAARTEQSAPPVSAGRSTRSARPADDEDDEDDDLEEDDDLRSNAPAEGDDDDDDDEDEEDEPAPRARKSASSSRRAADSEPRSRRAEPTETRVGVDALVKAIGQEFAYHIRVLEESVAMSRSETAELRAEVVTLRKALDDNTEAADEAVERAEQILKAIEPLQEGTLLVKSLSERFDTQTRETPSDQNTAVSGRQAASGQVVVKAAVHSPGVTPTASDPHFLAKSMEVDGLLKAAHRYVAEFEFEMPEYGAVVKALQSGSLTPDLVEGLSKAVSDARKEESLSGA
jgi:hypothetical protein